MADWVCTGVIIPRDYGLRLPVRISGEGARHVFVSPMRYALGQTMLETPGQLRARVRDRAMWHGSDAEELEEMFLDGIVRRFGTKNAWRLARGNVVRNVRGYGDKYAAEVKSKSGRPRAYLDVLVHTGQGLVRYPGSCDCREDFYARVKSERPLCTHMAALELALVSDARGDTSLTGRRPKRTTMPFGFRDSREGERLLTDMLFDYFVERREMHEIDRSVLGNRDAYSTALYGLLSSRNAPEFRVMRQEERRIAKTADRAFYAEVGRIKRAIRQKLRGFDFAGYGLEFKGTKFESVSERYVRDNKVYAITVLPGKPPVVVRKRLGQRVEDWLQPDNAVPWKHPFDYADTDYRSVDDATRRASETRIIVPRHMQISGDTARRYDAA